MPLVFPLLAMLRKLWGRPPGLRGTPPSRLWDNGASVLQGASRPTGASAAVQGGRPTIYAGAQHRKNEGHELGKLRATQRVRAFTGATGGLPPRRTQRVPLPTCPTKPFALLSLAARVLAFDLHPPPALRQIPRRLLLGRIADLHPIVYGRRPGRFAHPRSHPLML